jgi:hypothetical protein
MAELSDVDASSDSGDDASGADDDDEPVQPRPKRGLRAADAGGKDEVADPLCPNGQQWTQQQALPSRPRGTRTVRTSFRMPHVLEGHAPTDLDIFKAYFPCDLLQEMVTATQQAAGRELSTLTSAELLRFFGVWLAIGLNKGAVPRADLWAPASSSETVRGVYDSGRFGMNRHRCVSAPAPPSPHSHTQLRAGSISFCATCACRRGRMPTAWKTRGCRSVPFWTR